MFGELGNGIKGYVVSSVFFFFYSGVGVRLDYYYRRGGYSDGRGYRLFVELL